VKLFCFLFVWLSVAVWVSAEISPQDLQDVFILNAPSESNPQGTGQGGIAGMSDISAPAAGVEFSGDRVTEANAGRDAIPGFLQGLDYFGYFLGTQIDNWLANNITVLSGMTIPDTSTVTLGDFHISDQVGFDVHLNQGAIGSAVSFFRLCGTIGISIAFLFAVTATIRAHI
jgi:hypothetical protein